MERFKTIIRKQLHSRKLETQKTETNISIKPLNRTRRIGRAVYRRVLKSLRGKIAVRLKFDPCNIVLFEQGEISGFEALDPLLNEEYAMRETRSIDVALKTANPMPLKTAWKFIEKRKDLVLSQLLAQHRPARGVSPIKMEHIFR